MLKRSNAIGTDVLCSYYQTNRSRGREGNHPGRKKRILKHLRRRARPAAKEQEKRNSIIQMNGATPETGSGQALLKLHSIYIAWTIKKIPRCRNCNAGGKRRK